MIVLTKHARDKLKRLVRDKIKLTQKDIVVAITDPERIDRSRLPLLIAQSELDDTHVLRVVYKQQGNEIKIITFYPGKKRRYGQ